MRLHRLSPLLCAALVAILLACIPRPGRAAGSEPFTFPDLLELVQQKVPTPKILEILTSKCLTFLIDADAVSNLRAAGADDSLLEGIHFVCNPYQELKDTQDKVADVQHQLDSLRLVLRSLSDSAIARRAKLEEDSLALVRAALEAEQDNAARAAQELKDGPRNAAKAYAELGAKYAAAGNFERADREYRAAVRVTAPGKPGANEKEYRLYALELGKLLYDRGMFNEAIEQLGHSLEAGESWEAYYYTGLAWRGLKAPERAYRAWKRSLEIADNKELAQKSTDRMKELSAGH